MNSSQIRCALAGYGSCFNWGRAHGRWINATRDLRLVAVCDTVPERTAAAKRDFPQVRTFPDVSTMLAEAEVDLVTIITPHYTHCPLALECLKAGKHVIVDKAFCLNVAEANAMIQASKQAGTMLAAFHNRRHDGNFRAIKEVVRQGTIGEVFHVELYAGGYGRPNDWWYSQRELSGGAFYFWGPHAIDWVLDLVRSRIRGVTGFHHKLIWHGFTNEDRAQAVILFENGVVAEVTWSHIDVVGKPLWRLLGTKGGIEDTGEGAITGYVHEVVGPPGGSFRLLAERDGAMAETAVPYLESDWLTYYEDIASHLLGGGPVPVSAEEARRVVGVLEATERSARTGRTEEVAHENEWSVSGDG